MNSFLQKINHSFAAGALGAFTASLLLFFFRESGLARLIGVSLRPEWSFTWLYPRIFWGGILGFLLLLPFLKGSLWRKGFLLSLVPTTLEFFNSYAAIGAGNMGFKMGLWAPCLILGINALACTAAVYWSKKTASL